MVVCRSCLDIYYCDTIYVHMYCINVVHTCMYSTFRLILYIVFRAVVYIYAFIGSSIWTRLNIGRNITYFPYDAGNLDPALEGFIRFWTYLIIYQVRIYVYIHMYMNYVMYIATWALSFYWCFNSQIWRSL